MSNENPIPIACSLNTQEFRERRSLILRKLWPSVQTMEELPAGFAYTFLPNPGVAGDIGMIIDLERECCPFLSFAFRAEPGDGSVHLTITGPEGSKGILRDLFTPQPVR